MDERQTSSDQPGEQLAEWVEPVGRPDPAPRSVDPGRYVSRIPALGWLMVGGSLVPLITGYLIASGRSLEVILWYMLICAIIGIMETLAATAWGAAIAMTESARCGSLFVVIPPYMFYYAATRWRWMAQPSILFISGLALAFGAIFAGRHLMDAG